MPKMLFCLHVMLEMYMTDTIHGGSSQCSERCRCEDADILTHHLFCRCWDKFGHYLEQEIAPVEQVLVLGELTRIISIQHKHN